MTLYYTTSAGENQEQTNPQASLGGYKSSTPVKNDDFDNLFGELSTLTINQNKDHYIALMLVNETTDPLTNVEIWSVIPEGCYSKIAIAVVDPAVDSTGVLKMERTREIYNRPFVGDFVEYVEASKGVIGDMAVGEYVGIWLKRSLDMTAINAGEDAFYELDPTRRSMYREVEHQTVDSIDVKISWT